MELSDEHEDGDDGDNKGDDDDDVLSAFDRHCHLSSIPGNFSTMFWAIYPTGATYALHDSSCLKIGDIAMATVKKQQEDGDTKDEEKQKQEDEDQNEKMALNHSSARA